MNIEQLGSLTRIAGPEQRSKWPSSQSYLRVVPHEKEVNDLQRMKISIITATFNSIRYIGGVLASIQQQKHRNVELIVIDGGSTDGTVELLQQSKLVTRIVSEPDNGIYDALNKGIRLATGDIIGFLHSDDLLYSPTTLEDVINTFNKKGEAKEPAKVDGVYGDLLYVNKIDTKKVIRYWKSCVFKPNHLNKGWMPPHSSLFIRHEVYEKHGLFDLQFHISADYEFMLRIFKDPTLHFEYIPEVITKMRVGGVSNRSIKNIIQKSKEDFLSMRKNKLHNVGLVLLMKNITKIPQFFNKKKSFVSI